MPSPGPGGTQTSLADRVSWLTSFFRPKREQKKGAPIYSYSVGNDASSISGNMSRGDIGQFTTTYAPGALFSPGNPVVPTDRQIPRAWNYPVSWNINYRPRSYEAVGYAELRALAQAYDIVSLAIETRKDQMEALEFQIKPTDPKQDGSGDSRIKELQKFWRKPDGVHDFALWLRQLLDDLLIIDAPAIEVRRNRGGQIIGLDQIDGSSIKVLLDETGRRPRPPAPAYEQVIHGRPWVLLEDGNKVNTDDPGTGNKFNDGQLIYLPRNPRIWKGYGFSPVEQIYTTINIGLRRQAKQLLYFTAGNVPAGIVNAPETWSPAQIAEFQDWFDSKVKGNLEGQNQVIWGPAGAKYQPFADPPHKDQFDEWLARIVCYAFSLPPSAFTQQVNRATAQTAQEVALQEGLAPIMGWVKRLCDLVIQDLMGYDDLEFAWIEKKDLDPTEQAKILDIKVRNGTMAINEARDIDGQDPVEGGDTPMVYLPTGPVLVTDIAAMSAAAANPPPPPNAQPGGVAEGDGTPGAESERSNNGSSAPTGKKDNQ